MFSVYFTFPATVNPMPLHDIDGGGAPSVRSGHDIDLFTRKLGQFCDLSPIVCNYEKLGLWYVVRFSFLPAFLIINRNRSRGRCVLQKLCHINGVHALAIYLSIFGARSNRPGP